MTTTANPSTTSGTAPAGTSGTAGASPAPELPRHPFTTADAKALGISRFGLARLVSTHQVRRVVRGVYAPADLPDTIETRTAAAALVVSTHHVLCDRTAAWIWGIDVLTHGERDVLPPIETSAIRGHQPSRRNGVRGRSRDLKDDEIVEIGGVRLTSPLRTALDLGCLLERRDALGALDAFARTHGLTAEQYVAGARAFRGRRGVVQLKELAPLADPRAESIRESWTRLAIRDAGLPAPEPQVWVHIDEVPLYRIDLAYERKRIAIEYNGFEGHERTAEQRRKDRERRAWLEANGWTVIEVRRGDFTGDGLERWLRELREALAPSYSNLRRLERGSRRPN